MSVLVVAPWFMTQKVVVEELKGHGALGPVYEAPRTVLGRVEPRRRKITNRQGEEVVCEGVAYFVPSYAGRLNLAPGARITVAGKRFTVEEVREHVDLTGTVAYVEAFLR